MSIMDTIAKKVATNSFEQIIGTAIKIASTLVITSLLTRYLGTSAYGKYSFVFVYVSLLAIVSNFGITNIVVREISQDKARAGIFLGNTIILRSLLSLGVLLLVGLTSGYLNTLRGIRLAVYLAALVPILESLSSIRLIFQVHLRMVYSVIARVVSDLISVLLIAWIVWKKGSLLSLVAVSPISVAIGLVVLIFYARKFVKVEFSVDLATWKGLIRAAIPWGVAGVMYIILWKADTLMLSVMQGDAAVGIYQLSRRFIDLSAALSGTIIISIFPVMSELYLANRKKEEAIYQRAFIYVATVSFLLSIFFILTAKDLVGIIAGKGFEDSILSLKILGLSIPPYFIGALAGTCLLAADKQRICMIYSTCGTVINILLNLWLIPRYSYFGASSATVVALIIEAVAAIYFTAKLTNMHILWKEFLRLCFVTLVIGLLAFLGLFLGLGSILVTFLSCISYVLLLHFMKVISMHDFLALLKQR